MYVVDVFVAVVCDETHMCHICCSASSMKPQHGKIRMWLDCPSGVTTTIILIIRLLLCNLCFPFYACGGAGDGFFLACEDLGECWTIHSAHMLFSLKKKKNEAEISSRTLISLFRPGSVYSGSASWDNCSWVFSDNLYVSSFSDRFPHCACTAA